MGKAKILVVDDEPQIGKILTHSLSREGFDVVVATNGEEGLTLLEKEQPALAILDVMLPDMDGFELYQEIKKRCDLPVIFLTARSEEVDRLVGFRLGADDYQVKPFSPAELALRVKAVLRRHGDTTKNQEEVITYPQLKINRRTREVEAYGEKKELTAKEFDLLWLLASHPNQVFTRMQILNQVWNSDFYGDENTVTVHIRRLREKIEKNPAQPVFIKTVWGVGYKFELK
ncbi:MAG: hypothetical protein PWQ91_1327 [Eubacteriales bacterium]|nr:hypothetical protein [Eubacteriales bacterium]MDN5364265.1 hypothetical protein [Eubacteriales bacterium]